MPLSVDMRIRWLGATAVCVGCCIAAGAARGGEPLRIVPQLAWGDEGRTVPGRNLAAWCDRAGHVVRLIDTAARALVWSIPLTGAAETSFSPDGRWLAACGGDAGLLLDLRSAKLAYFDQLRGQFIRFTRDSRQVVVLRRLFQLGRNESPRDEGLFFYDLEGKRQAVFPVAMEVPHCLEVLPDGKTVRVLGAYGNPYRHVPRMGTAELIVNLETGKSEEKRGPIGRAWLGVPPDPTLVKLPGPPKDAPWQMPRELFWDEAAGIGVQVGSGRPAGNAIKSWDIPAGRFLATLGRRNEVTEIGGFLGPGVLLANAWKDGRCRVSMIDARTGAVTQTGLERAVTSPAPDGRHFTALFGLEQPTNRWLGLYAVPPGEPLYREDLARTGQAIQAWSRDGKWLVRSPWRGEKRVLHAVRTADGQTREIGLGDLPGDPQDGNRPPALWSLDVEGDSGRVAAGLGSSRMGTVILYDLAGGTRQAVIDGFPVWVQAVRFVGPGRLLTATRGGRVQLWDLKVKKPLWTTETGEEVVQFGLVRGGPCVVCVHLFRSASLVRLKDGQVVRRTRRLVSGDSSVALPWVHPALVGDGTLALEMAPDAMQLRLVDAATGTVRLTCCAMPDDQWIAYAPDGAWDGSQGIHACVKFYRGFKPLAPAEADGQRDRAKIEAAIHAAFGQRSTKSLPSRAHAGE